VAKTSAIQASVNFTLTNDPAYANTSWTVYSANTGTALATGVTAANSGAVLTLTHAVDLPATTYYVSATESGKTESVARLALMVTGYVPVLIDLTGKTTQNEIRDAITADLSKVTGSGTQDDPKVIPLANLDLSSGSNLEYLFKGAADAIASGANGYISLDLSGCTGATITGMEVDDGNGKLSSTTRDRVAAITLPATVTILAFSGSDGAFRDFTNLKSISAPGVITVGTSTFYQCNGRTSSRRWLWQLGGLPRSGRCSL
jgi:hypothetical protein